MIIRSFISFRVLRSSQIKFVFIHLLIIFPLSHLRIHPFQSFYHYPILFDSFFRYLSDSLHFRHFLNSSPQFLLHSFPPEISAQKQNYVQANSLQQYSMAAKFNFNELFPNPKKN